MFLFWFVAKPTTTTGTAGSTAEPVPGTEATLAAATSAVAAAAVAAAAVINSSVAPVPKKGMFLIRHIHILLTLCIKLNPLLATHEPLME